MPTAYVFISCTMGSEERIIRQIAQLLQVKEVRGIYGVHDIFVKIKSDTTQSLNDAIIYKIRKIPGITSTVTLIIIDKQGGKG
jgi:DNA-binding Lrp family transcriptional regulator